MLLRRTIHKTKKFLNRTLQNFKFFIFGSYQKLSKAPSFKLFNNQKMQQLDNFYKEFCEQLDSNHAKDIHTNIKADIESNGSMNTVLNSNNNKNNNNNNNKGTNMKKDQKSVVFYSLEDTKDVGCSNRGSQSQVLEQKMKELEMMDMKDEEQVLDIEEVLHYYSLLTSPIYQDLVDKFFTDMYSDFYVPQPPIRSNSINSSIRRLGPLNV